MRRSSNAPGELFLRVIGKRTPPRANQLPPLETRQALAAMAQYLTRAPKGLFIYPSHEAANRDRDGWQVEAMVAAAKQRHG
ncbi:MAG: hypothetical protein IPI67_36980 [Myxococcales bacterium]|nr:hypothetical protein [Myxococcales bacterium]